VLNHHEGSFARLVQFTQQGADAAHQLGIHTGTGFV
jgi:hypothetical protein